MSTHRRSLYFNYALSVCIALLGLLAASSLSPDPVVNGTVGESVLLPAGLSQPARITGVQWIFGKDVIADEENINGITAQFRNRVHLNRNDWSLTITQLRAEDSGGYHRDIETADGQLPALMITLHVYEKISAEMERKPSNETCSATLLCTTNQTKHVSYRWKRGDQDLPEYAGMLEVSLSSGERGVIFTCVASNPVSEAAASIRESCGGLSNIVPWQIYAGIGGISLLVLISTVITAVVCKKKKPKEAVTKTPEQSTVYAQIERQTAQTNHVEKSSDAQQSDNLPMTVYATVNLKQAPGKSCETQYDTVKFNRNDEGSPYQQIL
ncbi:SLAM family member 5-like isoform X2 [Polyodon spathula]|uniref:SLAM family member 5-like isoform X2 n=1 Tax=Polyodon spathula TaxID=7913 RepID=UPI001B7E99ED|nr:SLAM family member 5-like isoform X2 [Polyodon spathula]